MTLFILMYMAFDRHELPSIHARWLIMDEEAGVSVYTDKN